MQRPLMFKILTIFVLAVLLFVPLSMIRGTVLERQQLRSNVVAEIAKSAFSSQIVSGPMLIIPYKQKVREISRDAKGNQIVSVGTVEGTKEFLPETLNVSGALGTEARYRGIYKALLYNTRLTLNGYFELPAQFGVTEHIADYEWGPANLIMGISDIRGIKSNVSLQWEGQSYAFLPGSPSLLVKSGVHSNLGRLAQQTAARYTFSLQLDLQGLDSLQFAPVGKVTRVALSSTWPHPSFVGRYLPEKRTITAQGFHAVWQTSFFSTNMQQLFLNCANTDCPPLAQNTLGVALIEPVDVYLKSERALKYGFLYIALTFVAFFLFEVLKNLRIHPIQYALVGVALALFYLLLLSLSEHIAFALAYGIAATSSIGLLGFYISYVLKSARRGLVFAGFLTALYSLLYVLLLSEDFGLVIGALLLFLIVMFIMVVTRKVDWYSLELKSPPA